MRWIFGLVKIVLVVLVLAVIIKLIPINNIGMRTLGFINEKMKELRIAWFGDKKEDIADGDKNSSEYDNKTGQENNNEDKKENEPIIEESVPHSGSEYFLTLDEVLSIQNISLKDKLTGLSIISKIRKPDIDKIIEMTKGGITSEEFALLREILQSNLDSKDIECLNEILVKNKRLYSEGTAVE